MRRNHALFPTIDKLLRHFSENCLHFTFCHSLYFTRVSGWPVYEIFYLTLALAWSISCCFSLVSVWICCSWACLSCSSCLRKASSHAFNLSTAELKTSKTEDNVNETMWNHQIPGQPRPQAFPGYLPFSNGKALGTRLISGSLFCYRPARERLARDAPGDEKKRL